MGWKAELAVQFGLAVVSGAVAGLIAGWVLMLRQVKTQQSIEDSREVIKLLHSLQRQRALVLAQIHYDDLKNYGVAAKDRTKITGPEATKSNFPILSDLHEIARQAELISSPRYSVLKNYLMYRIQHEHITHDVDRFELGRTLTEIVEDVTAYIYPDRSLRSLVKRLIDKRPHGFLTFLKPICVASFVEDVTIFLETDSAEIKKHGYSFPRDKETSRQDTKDLLELISQGFFEVREDGRCIISRQGWREFATYLAHQKASFWENVYRGDPMREFELIKNQPRKSLDEMFKDGLP